MGLLTGKTAVIAQNPCIKAISTNSHTLRAVKNWSNFGKNRVF